jgi:hypothetical protein
MKFDSLHFALIAIVVLLAVYGFGSGGFRGGAILEGGKFNDKLDVFEQRLARARRRLHVHQRSTGE